MSELELVTASHPPPADRHSGHAGGQMSHDSESAVDAALMGERRHLLSLAFRMLGTVVEAEDTRRNSRCGADIRGRCLVLVARAGIHRGERAGRKRSMRTRQWRRLERGAVAGYERDLLAAIDELCARQSVVTGIEVEPVAGRTAKIGLGDRWLVLGPLAPAGLALLCEARATAGSFG
jgi:hypothetical protein